MDDEEDVRHLGFWATPNDDWKGMVDRVHASTVEAINIVKHPAKGSGRPRMMTGKAWWTEYMRPQWKRSI